jgi:anti-sigma factor RsiW
MTCQDFNDNLYRYLDESLDEQTRAAAVEHLRSCSDCRAELKQEEQFAAFLTPALKREVAGVFFDARPLSGLTTAPQSGIPSLAELLAGWLISLRRHAGLAALASAAVILLLGLTAVQRFAPQADRPAPEAQGSSGQEFSVINAPLERESHFFERSGNTVRDGVTWHRAVAHARFH